MGPLVPIRYGRAPLAGALGPHRAVFLIPSFAPVFGLAFGGFVFSRVLVSRWILVCPLVAVSLVRLSSVAFGVARAVVSSYV